MRIVSIMVTVAALFLMGCSNSAADRQYATEVLAAFEVQEDQYKNTIPEPDAEDAAGSHGHGAELRVWGMSLYVLTETLAEIESDGVSPSLTSQVDELIKASLEFVEFYATADSTVQVLEIATMGDRVQQLKIQFRKSVQEIVS